MTHVWSHSWWWLKSQSVIVIPHDILFVSTAYILGLIYQQHSRKQCEWPFSCKSGIYGRERTIRSKFMSDIVPLIYWHYVWQKTVCMTIFTQSSTFINVAWMYDSAKSQDWHCVCNVSANFWCSTTKSQQKEITTHFLLKNTCLVCFLRIYFCFSDLISYFFKKLFINNLVLVGGVYVSCLFVIIDRRSNNFWTHHRAAAWFKNSAHVELWSAAP